MLRNALGAWTGKDDTCEFKPARWTTHTVMPWISCRRRTPQGMTCPCTFSVAANGRRAGTLWSVQPVARPAVRFHRLMHTSLAQNQEMPAQLFFGNSIYTG